MTTDLTTQIRDYLDAISPPITPEEIVTGPVTEPEGRRSLRRGPLIGVAAFVAVLVVFGVAVLISDGGGENTPEPAGPVEGETLEELVEAATLEELHAAVRLAVDGLVEAPGFTVAQETFYDSQLGGSVWAASRPDGDFVSLTAHDVSIASSATGATSGIEITARAYVDGVLYHAATTPEGDTPWSEAGEAQTPDDRHLPIGVQFPEGLYPPTQEDLEENEQMEVTSQRLSNGGTRWTATQSSDTSEFVMTWDIHPDGHLAEYSFETNQATSPEFPVPSLIRLGFQPAPDPGPISTPPVGTPLDPTQYDIPQDLDLLH